MLNILRKKHIQKKIIIVLAAIIIPAFVLFGTKTSGKKSIKGRSYVGLIDGKKVAFDEFYKVRKGAELQLILNYGGRREFLDRILEDRALVNRLAWERVVLLEAADRKKLKVTDREVVGFVTSLPIFLQKSGFDKKVYNYITQKVLGMDERTFEEHIRQSIKIDKFRNIIVGDVTVTDGEVLEAYRNDHEEGKISYLLVNREDYRESVEIEDDRIEEYYGLHEDMFTVPETVSLLYMALPYTNIYERNALTDMARGIYKKVLVDPERISEIASDNGIAVEETGPFSRIRPYAKFNFDDTVYDKIFGMKEGSVETFADESASGSVYIARLESRTPETVRPIGEVKASIESILKGEKTESLSLEKAEEVLKRIETDQMTLEKAASRFKLKMLKTDFVKRADYVEEVGMARDILDKTFRDRPDLGAGPYKTRKGYIIVRLDEFRPIDPVEFEKKKEEYRDKSLALKKTKSFGNWLTQAQKTAELALDLKYL